jgi:zinc protease
LEAVTIRFQLENGLTVLFHEQHTAKVAAFQAWVKAGSADERAHQAGLAHFHEHMLFKGTARRGLGQIANEVEAHGGEINAWTSFDQTVYHLVLASQFAYTGLDILADALRHSAFEPNEVAREIEVVCEEIRRSYDSPGRRAARDLFATAYRVHPYGKPVTGTEESVRTFTREKVLEFYEGHYAPSNIVLSMVGDLTEAQARAWGGELFGGDWNRSYGGSTARPVEPAPSGLRIFFSEEDVKETYLNVAFPIPAIAHPDVPALDALAMVIGQGETSRLVLELKRKKALVNDVRCYAYTPNEPGLLAVGMTTPPKEAAAALEQALMELAPVRTEPVDEQELAKVKSLVESDAVYHRETVQGLARKLGFYESAAGGIEREAEYYARFAALTTEDLRRAAENYLRFDRAIATGLFPRGSGLRTGEIEELVERAGRPRVSASSERRPPPAAATQSIQLEISSRRPATSGVMIEKLPSGASIIVREERAIPLFAIRAAFLGGLRYESEETNGLSTLISRMLTRGTSDHTGEEIAHIVDACAGSMSGQAGRNSLGMRGEFLSKHFDRAFDLFAECLLRPDFPEGELERERSLLLQDINAREDHPASVALELFAQTLFQVHPYRLPILGSAASVKDMSADQLRDHHGRFLNPASMSLCVVGDVEAERVIALARQAFGTVRDLAAAPAVEVEPPLLQPRTSKQLLNRAQTHLVLGFRAARVTDPWRYSLDVLSTILSGQGGRLFLELRDKKSMAYSVSSFSVEGVDPGYFGVYMGTSPSKVEDALEGMRAELSRICEIPVGTPELERAKQNLIGSHEIGLQRNGARAGLLALDHCYGLGLETFARYSERIASVTARDVQEVARRVIDFNRSALAVVGP